MTEKATSTKLFNRLLAVVLVAVFLMTFFVGSNIRVRISADKGNDAENAAASYLIENTELINEDIFQRSKTFLRTRLAASQHFNDFYSSASIKIANGSYEGALDDIKSCIVLMPDEDEDGNIMQDLYIKKGCLEAMLNDYESALFSFRNISDENRYRSDISQIIVHILIEQGDMESAESYLADYLQNVAADELMRNIYAEVLYTNGKYHMAAQEYVTLIDMVEDEKGNYHLMRGLCYEQAGKYNLATADFQTALDSGYEDKGFCYNHMAMCSYVLANFENAVNFGEMSLDHQSDQVDAAEVHNIVGLGYFQTARYSEAIESFNNCLNESDEMHSVYYYRGVCYMVKGNYQEAISDYKKSIEYGLEPALSYYNSGLCNVQINKINEAKQDFAMVENFTDDNEIISSAQEFLSILN